MWLGVINPLPFGHVAWLAVHGGGSPGVSTRSPPRGGICVLALAGLNAESFSVGVGGGRSVPLPCSLVRSGSSTHRGDFSLLPRSGSHWQGLLAGWLGAGVWGHTGGVCTSCAQCLPRWRVLPYAIAGSRSLFVQWLALRVARVRGLGNCPDPAPKLGSVPLPPAMGPSRPLLEQESVSGLWGGYG